MITIFQGRKLSLDRSEDVIHAQVAVALRDHIHHLNAGCKCNPFAVFIKIALHTDQYGWAFPSSAGIGISTAHKRSTSKKALAAARAHLLTVRIDGHRVLAIYHQRRPDGTFGRQHHRILPDAWPDTAYRFPAGEQHERLLRPVPSGSSRLPTWPRTPLLSLRSGTVPGARRAPLRVPISTPQFPTPQKPKESHHAQQPGQTSLRLSRLPRLGPP
jgi:hypothetical protein